MYCRIKIFLDTVFMRQVGVINALFRLHLIRRPDGPRQLTNPSAEVVHPLAGESTSLPPVCHR